MKSKSKKVVFIVPTPLEISPSQRFRFEQYLPALKQNDISYVIKPYFTLKGRKALYSNNLTKKVSVVMYGYIKRILLLFTMPMYDYVFIHREAAPVGPPIFPWIIAKMMRKKIIYDFDDAIWLPLMSDYNRKFSFVKSFSKVGKLCRWSYNVVVGNKYLQDYALQYNKRVTIIPTVVNTETLHNVIQNQDIDTPAIGWTGSFSTLVYLDIVLPVLQRLQEKYDFVFYVIADKDPQLPLKRYKFIEWNKDTEVTDLLKFHIGLMPLYDDEFSKGKCGFKAIQYMSLGLPAVVSPVGVNTEIVDDGINGFICDTETEWELHLESLLINNNERKKMGQSARKKIESKYSVASSTSDFLRLFSNS